MLCIKHPKPAGLLKLTLKNFASSWLIFLIQGFNQDLPNMFTRNMGKRSNKRLLLKFLQACFIKGNWHWVVF